MHPLVTITDKKLLKFINEDVICDVIIYKWRCDICNRDVRIKSNRIFNNKFEIESNRIKNFYIESFLYRISLIRIRIKFE